MTSDLHTSGPAEFGGVDSSADPGGLIRFLDAASTLPELRAAKLALLKRLVSGKAHTALDVGCGTGADLVEFLEIAGRCFSLGAVLTARPALAAQSAISWTGGRKPARPNGGVLLHRLGRWLGLACVTGLRMKTARAGMGSCSVPVTS